MAIGCIVLFQFSVLAQGEDKLKLTLERCIEIAIKNNVDFKRSELDAKSSKLDYNAAKSELLPTLNMSYNLGLTNGRSIDPFSNDIVNQKFEFSNSGLIMNTPIFNGFRVFNGIRQNKLNMEAAEMEALETKQNLILEVTLLYIQVLNNRELLKLSRSGSKTTSEQLKRLEVEYQQGNGNPVDYTDMKGQYAMDLSAEINAENTLNSTILELLKLLNLDSDSELEFEGIFDLIGSKKYEYSSDNIYDEALQNLATFKAKKHRVDAAEKGVKVARSNYYPEVSIFGQLNTTFSSAARVFAQTGNAVVETGDFVNIDGRDFQVQRNEMLLEPSSIGYGEQFENNLNSVVGVSVSIPILNGFQAKNKVRQQKIEREKSVIELENTKVVFKRSIEQAYNNMESAFERYNLLLGQVASFEESFRVNEVRFLNGVSNIVDYITSKNNMDRARIDLSRTKFEYLLRVKILEYYRGV